MKRTIILSIAVVAVLCAAATDRFYIEDFTIAPGETRTVNIILDNETAYTAFQTDIYMPAGLTIEMEDGDYIFDRTQVALPHDRITVTGRRRHPCDILFKLDQSL